jgi:hypothetical protein
MKAIHIHRGTPYDSRMAPKKRKSNAPLTEEEKRKIVLRISKRLQTQLGIPVKDHVPPEVLIRSVGPGLLFRRAIDEELGQNKTDAQTEVQNETLQRKRSPIEYVLIGVLTVVPFLLILWGFYYNNVILMIAGVLPILIRPRGPGTYGLVSLSTRVVDKLRSYLG